MNSRALHVDPIDDAAPDLDDLVGECVSYAVEAWGFDSAAWPSVEVQRVSVAGWLTADGADAAEVTSFLRTGWSRFASLAEAEALAVARFKAEHGTPAERARAETVLERAFAWEDTDPGVDVDLMLKEAAENAA